MFGRGDDKAEGGGNRRGKAKNPPKTSKIFGGHCQTVTFREIFIILFQTQSLVRSKADKFKDKLVDILNTARENIDVFSVQLKQKYPPLTDIRFSAHGSPYYKTVKLNGLILMHREEVIVGFFRNKKKNFPDSTTVQYNNIRPRIIFLLLCFAYGDNAIVIELLSVDRDL